MIDRSFFIYVHRRADDGAVFYVGKGTRTKKKQYSRARAVERRNPYWRRIVEKHGLVVEVVADYFDEADAFAAERALIAEHKRACDGGTLCNLTLGGEGHAGLPRSEQARRKTAAALTGRVRSWEHCRAISKAKTGARRAPEVVAAHAERMSGAGNPWYGKKQPASMSAKKSVSMKGKLAGAKHPFFGKKRPEVSAKLSGGNAPGARRVIDVATGRIYECARHAAAALGVSDTTLSRWLNGKRPNPSTMRFA